MIKSDGWSIHSTWENSQDLQDLYRRRCRQEEVEMTCHAQAADMLKEIASEGDLILDIGCGGGYFYHSIKKRKMPVHYCGIDAAYSLIEIGRNEMSKYGLTDKNLQQIRVEDLNGSADHIVCMNVLSYCDNYHRPLERMLKMAGKSVVLRESIREKSQYSYVEDFYLDSGVTLKTSLNHYGEGEILSFIESYGYSAEIVQDIRTGGEPEIVIDHPHYWTFIRAIRR